jgi:hypothetical protein
MSPDEVVLGSDYKRFPPHVLLANFFGSNANPGEKFSAPVKHDSFVAIELRISNKPRSADNEGRRSQLERLTDLFVHGSMIRV